MLDTTPPRMSDNAPLAAIHLEHFRIVPTDRAKVCSLLVGSYAGPD